MKISLHTALLISCFYVLPSCAQTKTPVVKAYGFYMIPIPGIIAVDENGNERNPKRDTVYKLYVETKANNISWEKAWQNGRSFSVISEHIKGSKAVIVTIPANEKIEITAQSGNSLWQIGLNNDMQQEKAPQQLAGSEILLKGKWKNQTFYYKIKSLKEMPSPLYQ